ncbi:FadR/GntR family transcriptional regulator [Saccharopolyspora sp. CA-218241]|uniref:FadR/GntR family transcriptional regulator n=1 Tax=Saccharopolyspora sp. CA-218241 TaxID=3240027 RepID=UPI003D97DD31
MAAKDPNPPGLNIQPVTRLRAHEEVARQLRDLVEAGTLSPGTQLPPERDLAQRFGVSRATMRQALSALQSAGLIESRVGKGTFTRLEEGATANVSRLAGALRGGVHDQLHLRRLLEPQIAREAASHSASSDLEHLRQCLARQEKCSDVEKFIEEDSTFHLAIAHATGNLLVVKMVEDIHELLRDSRERSLTADGGVARSLEGHRRITEAILGGDGDAAYDSMMAHLLDVERLNLETATRSNRSVTRAHDREPQGNEDPG